MCFSKGTLEFRNHGDDKWVKVDKKETEPVLVGSDAGCLPVVFIWMRNRPLRVKVSKKWGRDSLGPPPLAYISRTCGNS